MSRPSSDLAVLRQEIAACAARLIAEEGLEYVNAKRKAIRQLVGAQRLQGEFLPDNDEIAEEVRIYQQLYQSDTQPLRLATLRQTALTLMRLLAQFRPHLTGAVLNGTAGEHSDIHLQLFTDNVKDVEMFLLNQGIAFEAHEQTREAGAGGRTGGKHGNGRKIETLSFMWSAGTKPRSGRAEAVHLALYETNALRFAPSPNNERANLASVEQLVTQAAAILDNPGASA